MRCHNENQRQREEHAINDYLPLYHQCGRENNITSEQGDRFFWHDLDNNGLEVKVSF